MANLNTGGRLQLILIGAVFLGPFILAWLLYDPDGEWLPETSTAHGELIAPVKLVPDANLSVPRDEQDSPYPGIWTLVHVGDGACGETCAKSLYKTRQVRKSLGKEDRRVQRIFFLTSETRFDPAMAEHHPGLKIITADQTLADEFRKAIEPYDTWDIFLVDPLGNLIMRFTPGTGMKDMFKDLQKLLKISQIG
jgi:hypothetical protein